MVSYQLSSLTLELRLLRLRDLDDAASRLPLRTRLQLSDAAVGTLLAHVALQSQRSFKRGSVNNVSLATIKAELKRGNCPPQSPPLIDSAFKVQSKHRFSQRGNVYRERPGAQEPPRSSTWYP